MFTEERDSRDVLIGVVIVALVVGGIYTMKRDTPETVPATPLAVSTSSPATLRIEVGHGSIAKPSVYAKADMAKWKLTSNQDRRGGSYCSARFSKQLLDRPNR